VSSALDHRHLLEEVTLLRTCLEEKYGFDNIIGSSASLMRKLDVAARVAPSDVIVLVRGETGTGKEVVAKAIHSAARAESRPL
jgi:transcriptional regulator with GAF, ATPase, and Fis domain